MGSTYPLIQHEIMASIQQVCKVVLVGDACGKTTLVKSMRINACDEMISRTLGVEVHPIAYQKNGIFNVWDCASTNKDSSMYYTNANCVVIAFDFNSIDSMIYAQSMVERFTNLRIPHVMCATKCDYGPIEATWIENLVCTSAKNRIGIDYLVETILALIK
jgi:GTPase SAR1 family protein